ncbi:alpha/beta fold hydrolase [Halococcoides cellulosivorans]|uniref:Alpha/beta hydrolase n=1 Tax=Halococcoides cellulosivorans TaxID=1679096 RepID=A0A2R4WYH6_9EURY|nr:alpha/beta hydrolase [Halococcoides cellulosivorans]AWB26576.1 alpha/beta hydrolase [Halococcoides cellulosivorans]
MSLKRLLATGAGAIGVAAVGNHLLTRRAGPLGPPLDGTTDETDWRGFSVATTELGDPEDPDLLAIHGISAAASSHEFADVASELADDYHVIAPDLLGFGRSDRPRIGYDPAVYTGVIEAVLAECDEPTVLASSLSGAYTAAAVADHDIAELIAVCPTDRTMAVEMGGPLLRAPIVGRSVYNALVSRPSLRHFYADHGVSDPDAIDAFRLDYDWQAAHQRGARWAPAAFLEGALQPDRSLEALFDPIDAPVRLLWGADADLPPVDRGRTLADAIDAELVIFEESALLPHVERPERVVEVVTGTEPQD